MKVLKCFEIVGSDENDGCNKGGPDKSICGKCKSPKKEKIIKKVLEDNWLIEDSDKNRECWKCTVIHKCDAAKALIENNVGLIKECIDCDGKAKYKNRIFKSIKNDKSKRNKKIKDSENDKSFVGYIDKKKRRVYKYKINKCIVNENLEKSNTKEKEIDKYKNKIYECSDYEMKSIIDDLIRVMDKIQSDSQFKGLVSKYCNIEEVDKLLSVLSLVLNQGIGEAYLSDENKHGPKEKQNIWSDEEIIKAYKDKGSLRKAGDYLGISYGTVCKVLKDNGIEINNVNYKKAKNHN